MLPITDAEKTLCQSRQDSVDHTRIPDLFPIGNYERRLPVSMERMMENARDWEHLPYIHASSFGDIAGIEWGRWGWRAKASPAADNGEAQLLELLIDYDRNYWATTILSGPVSGVEIHTQARSLSKNEIEIDVRFYYSSPLSPGDSAMFLDVLTRQYALLYDEDLGLMSGRQVALDERARWEGVAADENPILVGSIETLSAEETTTVETPNGRFCVRKFDGDWIAHSATCPHMLGPLQDSTVEDDGSITCPWHGYRFDIATGHNLDKQCGALPAPPAVEEIDGKLYLVTTQRAE